jgi:hypothetical protein
MDKRILFVLFILVGSIFVAVLISYSFGAAQIVGYVAWFTSLSTAVYAIWTQPKQRTEPFLRIAPILEKHQGMIFIAGVGGTTSRASLNVWIENIGYSIAKNISVRCGLNPDKSIPLKENGVFSHPLLAPKERVSFQIVEYAETERLSSQQLTIEVKYENEDGKPQNMLTNAYSVEELPESLREVKTS